MPAVFDRVAALSDFRHRVLIEPVCGVASADTDFLASKLAKKASKKHGAILIGWMREARRLADDAVSAVREDWSRAGIEGSVPGHGMCGLEVGAEPEMTAGTAAVGTDIAWAIGNPFLLPVASVLAEMSNGWRHHPQSLRQPLCRQSIKARQAEEADLREVCLALIPVDRVGWHAEVCVSEISLRAIDNEAFTKAMRTEVLLPFTKASQGKMLKIRSMEVE